MTSRPGAILACVVLLASLAALSCSVSGAPPAPPTSSSAPNVTEPTSSAQNQSAQDQAQDQAVKTICEDQKVDVSVNKCREVYSTYPTGFVVDAATEIYDKNGRHIDSCGGNRFFTSDQAREESERKCKAYLVDCTKIVESCRSLR